MVFEKLSSRVGIRNFEGEVMTATVPRSIVALSGLATLIMFLDQMQESRTRLKPGPRKRESRAFDFIHSQQLDVEGPTGIQVLHDDRHVVDVLDAD